MASVSFRYSGKLTTPNERVRLLVQDTQEADPRFSEEEIAFILTQEGGNELRAAARLADILVARYAPDVDETAGRVSVAYSQRAKAYIELSKQLWGRANTEGVVPAFNVPTDASGEERPAQFTIGMNDNSRAGRGSLKEPEPFGGE